MNWVTTFSRLARFRNDAAKIASDSRPKSLVAVLEETPLKLITTFFLHYQSRTGSPN